MATASKQRFLSILTILVILVTALLSVTPANAKGYGTAEYTVKAGDSLKKIADRYGLTVEKILLANPQIDDPNLIYPGQVIILPAGRSEGLIDTSKNRIFVWIRERNGSKVESSERLYLVKSGDSIKRIAKAFGITEENLLAVNPQIEDANKIYRGELIHVPYGLSETAPSFYHTP